VGWFGGISYLKRESVVGGGEGCEQLQKLHSGILLVVILSVVKIKFHVDIITPTFIIKSFVEYVLQKNIRNPVWTSLTWRNGGQYGRKIDGARHESICVSVQGTYYH
jgi:hypothetical protein